MNLRRIVIASMAALAMSAGNAQADLIAGWDFSQYFTAGRLTIDGSTYIDTLPANYSSLDPTFEAGGLGSAMTGMLYMDGTFGSTGIDPTPGNSPVVPTPRRVGDYGDDVADIPVGDGAVQSNVNGAGLNAFNSFSILRTDSQQNTELLALTADSVTTLVFEADATGGPGPGRIWSLSFGGRSMNYESTSTVDVAFAPGCSGFGSPTNLVVNEQDQAFTVPFPGISAATTGCVRMTLGSGAVIDNVAITAVPEPGMLLSLGTGIFTISLLRRFRRS